MNSIQNTWERSGLGTVQETLDDRWGAMLAGGVAMIALGILAMIAAGLATLLTVVFIGALMMVGGLVQFFEAGLSGRWTRVLGHLLLGTLYVLGGLLFLYSPARGAMTLTFVLGVFLISGGVFRAALSFVHREISGWGWALASGIASIVLGFLILTALPVTAPFLLGFFVGVELFLGGVSWVALGSGLRRRLRQPPPEHRVLRPSTDVTRNLGA